MTDAAWTPTSSSPLDAFEEWRRREPLLSGATLFYLALCLPVLFAMQIDPRMTNDISVWAKPLKFLLSIATFLAPLAWFAGYLPESTRAQRWYRIWSVVIVVCASAELFWIIGAAANGVPSHFNEATPLMAAAYTAAGIGAVTLLTGAPVYGVLIWRNRGADIDPAFRLSLIIGLIATFPLTFVIAGYLGGAGSHFVGGAGSDANGMTLMGWARDGGDLRVGHFFALHAMHFIPAFGLIAAFFGALARPAVWAVGAGYVALTIFTFVQALNGAPFLPMIP